MNLFIEKKSVYCMKWMSFQGGMIVQLFHKVLEAYLVAEGLFDHELVEDGELTCLREGETDSGGHA